MVRRYGIRGRKRKQKEKCDVDSDEDEQNKKQMKGEVDEGRGEEVENNGPEVQEEEGKVADELEGIPLLSIRNQSTKSTRIVFVLEKASLKIGKVGKLSVTFICRAINY